VRAVVGVEAELEVRHVLGVLRHGPHVVRDVEADVADRIAALPAPPLFRSVPSISKR
jgi:hypothetical protein